MEESVRHNIWTWPCPQCGSTQKALVDNAYSNPHWECVCGYRFQYGPAFMDFYERQYEAWARGTGEQPVRAVGGHLYPETLRAIPQMWVERYGAVPDGWWEEYGECGIQRVVPEIRELVERAARLCNVDERLLVTRMEVEQGAFTYGWDGTTSHYGGGAAGDREKLRWLCGLDKTDSGPREGAWTGPALQLLGCAARFRWLYRGQSIPSSAGLPPLPKSVGPMAPLWQLGTGRQCVAANEATAMAFRYTPHVGGNRRLRDIGVLWFPDDYGSEEGASATESRSRTRCSS